MFTFSDKYLTICIKKIKILEKGKRSFRCWLSGHRGKWQAGGDNEWYFCCSRCNYSFAQLMYSMEEGYRGEFFNYQKRYDNIVKKAWQEYNNVQD